MSEFVLVGSYRYVPETGEFVGLVIKQEFNGDMTVLTVGAEDTEFAIMDWIKTTVALMRTQGRIDVQAADKYDRAKHTIN